MPVPVRRVTTASRVLRAPRALARRWERLREERDSGYVAVMTAMLLMVVLGFAAFALDVGRWYLVGHQAQKAADSAALAGVTSLPGDQVTAFSTAQKYSKLNGYGVDTVTTVSPAIDGSPTRLRVTVSRKVDNMFGALLGAKQTTITKSAVADYAGPVAMGSPCNVFGNDPDGGSNRGSSCDSVAGQLWASVNSPSSDKANGDAFHSEDCTIGILTDGCSGSVNTDYDPDGYFYSVEVKKAGMSRLTIELFDPVYAHVGLTCDSAALSGSTTRNIAKNARNPWVSDENTRYAAGDSSEFCTGDANYTGSTPMKTRFSVRPPTTNAWNPLAGAEINTSTCAPKTYGGYYAYLFNVLDDDSSSYDSDFAQAFRRWSTFCTIPNPEVGTYIIQVKTKGLGTDSANAGNRYSIRVSGGSSTNNNAIAISGKERMSIYSNRPGRDTQFFLARVPSGAAGQSLNIQLFDVGDADLAGDVVISPPPDSGLSNFTGCKAVGPYNGTLTNCTLRAVTRLTHNGRWQVVSVPIPTTYRCDDTDQTKCWVRLTYAYGLLNAPTDVTAWTANIEGDPVRLVE